MRGEHPGRELLGEVRCPSGEIVVGAPAEAGVRIEGLPRTLALDVWGVRMIEPELAHHWRWIYVDVLPGSRSIDMVSVGWTELGETLALVDARGLAPALELATTHSKKSFEVLRDVDDLGRLSRVRIDLLLA